MFFVEGGMEDGGAIIHACARLTASPRTGRAFWLDVGEGRQDEAAVIEGADYEVVVHDGSVRSIMAALEGVQQVAEQANADGEPPVVLIITMVGVWRLLSDWARARSVHNKAARLKRHEDPDADIEVTRHHRNDSYDVHTSLVAALRRIPGIVVMTGRGHWVHPTDKSGQPTGGPPEYVLDTHWGLGSIATMWLRLAGGTVPQIVAVNSWRAPHPSALPPLTEDWSLEALAFDVLGLDPAAAAVPEVVAPRPDRSPEAILAEAVDKTTTWARMAELYREAQPVHALVVTHERREEQLGPLLARLAEERAVSDPRVVADLHTSIGVASSVPALKQLPDQIMAAIRLGQVSVADRRRLQVSYGDRMRELQVLEDEVARQREAEEVGS
ncbi:hypothetical protein [Planomonospora sp. ID82291]|uniref:hypothetical protein n=1 Tax=Planomonospora sp. ID82291 TaxID=2738136 RepID=UPI0018C44F0E|nr:hypothetical protein [Planomonospora sp. ID82291]MBG0818708.1 hypothetical protein [Planomonospora sp. ID82291]